MNERVSERPFYGLWSAVHVTRQRSGTTHSSPEAYVVGSWIRVIESIESGGERWGATVVKGAGKWYSGIVLELV